MTPEVYEDQLKSEETAGNARYEQVAPNLLKI